jgi:sugar fermentation stimulation protein A
VIYDELLSGRLIRRHNRFLADIALDDGTVTTVHCPNSGSMKGCLGEDWPVRVSRSGNPKRKYPLTWELVHNGRCWIGINTHLANHLAADAINDGTVIELTGYECLRREVAAGENSRIDILLERPGEQCWVEVKNVTMVDDCGRYAFPDAVTSRGLKHLRELTALAGRGDRAVMLFVIQRSDGEGFAPARDIDPDYADGLVGASQSGVQVLAYGTRISPESNTISEAVPIAL